jgi:hypothetical protein
MARLVDGVDVTELVVPNALDGEVARAETPADLMRVLEHADALGSFGRKVRRSALAGGLLDAARDAYRAEVTAAFARLEVMLRARQFITIGRPEKGSPRVTISDFGVSKQAASEWGKVADALATARADLDEHRQAWLDLAEDDPKGWDDPTIAEIVRRATSGPDDEWYTPKWLFDALGLRFDVDVCAPVDRTYVSTPADVFYTEDDDGLAHDWDGLVWCNPPYSTPTPWAEKMIAHGDGVLLSHVPINGLWCLRAWNRAHVVRLLQGMEFVRPDGTVQRPAYWLQLVAFGPTAGDAVMTLDDRLSDDVPERFRPSIPFVPTGDLP